MSMHMIRGVQVHGRSKNKKKALTEAQLQKMQVSGVSTISECESNIIILCNSANLTITYHIFVVNINPKLKRNLYHMSRVNRMSATQRSIQASRSRRRTQFQVLDEKEKTQNIPEISLLGLQPCTNQTPSQLCEEQTKQQT